MKKCCRCGITKALDDFPNKKASIDGHCYICKICSRKKSKEYYKNHKEERKEYCRKWRIKNNDYCIKFDNDRKESRALPSKKWREKNNEYLKKYSKKYFKTPAGKLARSKQNSIRKRNISFELLFDKPKEWLCPIEYHHISDAFVVAIPTFIHRQYLGPNHRQKMKHIVEIMYNISYTIEDHP